MSDDEQAIRELVGTWLAASKKGNVAAILDMMTDDVIFQIPGHEPFGKAAFAAANANLNELTLETHYEIQEVKVLGDWAYMRNYLDISMTPKGGQTKRHSGYTLTILRKGDDKRWRISRDANLLTPKA